jgi:hypothetical protein
MWTFPNGPLYYDLCIYISIISRPVEPLCRWYLSIFCTAICAIPLCCELYSHSTLLLATFTTACAECFTCLQCGNIYKYRISLIFLLATDCRTWICGAGLLGWQHQCTNNEGIFHAVFDNLLSRPPSILVHLCPTPHYNNTYLDMHTEFRHFEKCKTEVYTIETQLSGIRSFYELSKFWREINSKEFK